jgi:hypothetical protein
LQTFKEFPHLWDYRHLSNFPGASVFEPSFGMTPEHNGATFEVTVRAHHICVSGFPEPAISHEANQVGTMLGFAAPASFDLGNEFVKLLIIWQNRIFAGSTLTHHAKGWVVVAGTGADAELENVTQNTQGVIENRWSHFLAHFLCPFLAVFSSYSNALPR